MQTAQFLMACITGIMQNLENNYTASRVYAEPTYIPTHNSSLYVIMLDSTLATSIFRQIELGFEFIQNVLFKIIQILSESSETPELNCHTV